MAIIKITSDTLACQSPMNCGDFLRGSGAAWINGGKMHRRPPPTVHKFTDEICRGSISPSWQSCCWGVIVLMTRGWPVLWADMDMSCCLLLFKICLICCLLLKAY